MALYSAWITHIQALEPDKVGGSSADIELITAVGCWRAVLKLARALRIPLEEGIASWPPDGVAPADL